MRSSRDDLAGFHNLGRRQSGHDLVQHEHVRLGRDGTGNLQSFAGAQGQLRCLAGGQRGETHSLDDLRGLEARQRGALLRPAEQGGNLDIFLERHREKRPNDLKRPCNAELRDAKRRQVRD